LPTKKNTGRKPRRARRKKSAKFQRIVLFTAGFLLLLFIGVYGLYLAKDKVSGPGITQSELSDAIASTDSNLRSAYFDMGVSSEHVRSVKLQNKAKDDIKWEYKDIVIEAPGTLSHKEIKGTITKSLSNVPGFESHYIESAHSITALLTINDIETHRIKFEFQTPSESQKTVKKETRETTKETKKVQDQDKKSAKLKEHIQEYKQTATTKPKVVIIVDDIGMNKSSIDKLLQIPAPLTIAVLPNLPYSEYAAREAHKKGREVMLHLPMEPKESSGYTAVDAGVDALIVGLPKTEILRRIDKNLSSIPHIQGVNNHMGSKFMESGELLELVMKGIKDKDLFFVDSMTSGASMGSEAASKFGVRSVERDVFLDDASKGASYVKSQLRELVRVSQKKGYAIGICHPYPGTVKALAEMIPHMQKEVEIASVSTLLDHSLQIGKNNN
jgi:polysaccharide deacetylase 2 family uncharacterized protein YibQ